MFYSKDAQGFFEVKEAIHFERNPTDEQRQEVEAAAEALADAIEATIPKAIPEVTEQGWRVLNREEIIAGVLELLTGEAMGQLIRVASGRASVDTNILSAHIIQAVLTQATYQGGGAMVIPGEVMILLGAQMTTDGFVKLTEPLLHVLAFRTLAAARDTAIERGQGLDADIARAFADYKWLHTYVVMATLQIKADSRGQATNPDKLFAKARRVAQRQREKAGVGELFTAPFMAPAGDAIN